MASAAYAGTLAWLYRLERQHGIDLKLERVRRAAAALGHPERAAPTVHIAGTNGKGSTAAMVATMLGADGRRVGLYTSPHLVSFRERIVVGGVPISEEAVVEGVARLRRALGPVPDLTCFELITLLGWLHFADAGVEATVLEVGLGGRLDATNVVTPEISVVTNVGMDHEAFLGNDLTSIAAEKAGIIKPGVPVVSGADGVAGDVVAARAGVLGCRLEVHGRDFGMTEESDGTLVYRSPAGVRGPLEVGLAGRHQRVNAALAVRALELAPALTPSAPAVVAGLAGVRWPGRLQLVRREPLVLLDGAHNPAGVAALVAEIEARAVGRRVRVLFGVMRDKGWETMLRALAGIAEEIVVTRPRQPRSAEPNALAAVISCPHTICDDPVAAYRMLLARSAPRDLVVVTGSLFLVGDVLPIVDPARAADAARERAAAELAGRC